MKNLLLVDDEQQSIDVFQGALAGDGNAVTIAKDGKTALELCKTQKFDVILIDEMMPDMSGNDLIKALKAEDSTSSIPLIVLTNYSDDNLVKEALAAGASDYILKFQMVPEDLVAKVEKLASEE